MKMLNRSILYKNNIWTTVHYDEAIFVIFNPYNKCSIYLYLGDVKPLRESLSVSPSINVKVNNNGKTNTDYLLSSTFIILPDTGRSVPYISSDTNNLVSGYKIRMAEKNGNSPNITYNNIKDVIFNHKYIFIDVYPFSGIGQSTLDLMIFGVYCLVIEEK